MITRAMLETYENQTIESSTHLGRKLKKKENNY